MIERGGISGEGEEELVVKMLHTPKRMMDRSWQRYVATPRGLLGSRILHSLDNELLRMELTNSQIADEEQSPVETPSRRVVAEEKDSRNGLAKARGTFVKAGGP